MAEGRRGKQRFFCENCTQEVSRNARICPHCGRFFSSVRCPVCSFTGNIHDFDRGCPGCGYLGGSSADKKACERGFALYGLIEDAKPRRELPGWVYGASGLILSALLVVLVVLLYREL